MTNKFKNFFSMSFFVLALVSMASGFYFLPGKGLDIAGYYFGVGFALSVIGQIIQISIAENDNSDV
jgi:hypothetical protein